MNKILLLMVLFSAQVWSTSEALTFSKTCHLRKLDLVQKSIKGKNSLYEWDQEWTVQVGDFKISFVGTSENSKSQFMEAWVYNQKSDRKCKLQIDDSGNTAAVYLTDKMNRIFIPKSYGSGDEYYIFDLHSCNRIKSKLDVYISRVYDDTIESESVCEPDSAGNCKCTKATVYRLNSQCDPVLDKKASDSLTKKTLDSFKPGDPKTCPKS